MSAIEYLNHIFNQDSRNMHQLADKSIDLMITSPPYNVTKQYDENLNLDEYLTLIFEVLRETLRVLAPGGIIGLNVANLGRKPYIPLDCYIIEILTDLKYTILNEIIWNKAASAGGSCAWGSWLSASNPTLRDVHEYIIIAQKKKSNSDKCRVNQSKDIEYLPFLDGKKSTMTEKELYSNIWTFGAESAKKVNHPAPFRVELPYRLIQMYSKKNDLILDPFMGSGSTAIAAIIAKRNFVGYDTNLDYIQAANRRILEFVQKWEKK
ncbi:Modification methylase MthZI [Candidatus Lokiarchaeum ossiferum]|uniref:Type II methyltransferase n=1 Tax=Candidatus Lokiarchaeum ossiferum TaxID=2951803 RepID=A0ABY6HMI6_9ARCH|nr:Modification methylase MthZI [Candidatus Lokiarchaeum sp. B-35]